MRIPSKHEVDPPTRPLVLSDERGTTLISLDPKMTRSEVERTICVSEWAWTVVGVNGARKEERGEEQSRFVTGTKREQAEQQAIGTSRESKDQSDPTKNLVLHSFLYSQPRKEREMCAVAVSVWGPSPSPPLLLQLVIANLYTDLPSFFFFLM